MLNITKLSYLILFAILSLYTVYHSLNDVAHNNVDFYGLTEYSNKNSTQSETKLPAICSISVNLTDKLSVSWIPGIFWIFILRDKMATLGDNPETYS